MIELITFLQTIQESEGHSTSIGSKSESTHKKKATTKDMRIIWYRVFLAFCFAWSLCLLIELGLAYVVDDKWGFDKEYYSLALSNFLIFISLIVGIVWLMVSLSSV
eukprot:CAMPEP_0116875022 /NCGR_PEP_ID=MMETSP0463-20121206/6725_1 /TAXON_ID=181622 /ORGANISM="Strombidinopsis sp, Strain SopsisLIS2011" /LENGTH=105 /DNA_ID=CAMNT_0004519733 /DNA_START=260 /DNA_END=577 /DNA_ORIENTATION=-